MNTTSLSECKEQWDTAGWCVVEDVFPPDHLEAAQAVLPKMFPTAEEFAASADPDFDRQIRDSDRPASAGFPFEYGALNRIAVHDAMIDLAQLLLETDEVRMYQTMAIAKYSDASSLYDQLLHVDYGNHTLVVPRADVGYQHLETFIYLSDVTPETAATRVVSREHTAGIPMERTYLALDEYAHLYEKEECASGPAGSVFVYRPDTYHRGVPLAARGAARFTLAVAFKPVATDWIGFHSLPIHAEDMAWHRFMRHATVRQLTVLGFPKPGDAYWTDDTLAGVAARYPSLDMTPWRDAMPAV